MLAAGQRGVPCSSYTPQQVKGAVCGNGRAARTRSRGWWQRCWRCRAAAPDHAADALAVAVCHVNRAPLALALARGGAMIALLHGEVAVRRADHVVVLCAGVGYRAAVSAETLRQMPAVGEQVTLHTHLIVARRRARAVRLPLPSRSASCS